MKTRMKDCLIMPFFFFLIISTSFEKQKPNWTDMLRKERNRFTAVENANELFGVIDTFNLEKESYLKEVENRLTRLLKERDILTGDFYGINLTAYRYVNIFDRLGYIRCRITQIDREIKKIRLDLCEMKIWKEGFLGIEEDKKTQD